MALIRLVGFYLQKYKNWTAGPKFRVLGLIFDVRVFLESIHLRQGPMIFSMIRLCFPGNFQPGVIDENPLKT